MKISENRGDEFQSALSSSCPSTNCKRRCRGVCTVKHVLKSTKVTCAKPARTAPPPCKIAGTPRRVSHVPMNPEGVVPEGAFAGVPRLRHVSVESGIRLIGPEAWQSCRQLRCSTVSLPLVAGSLATKPLRSAVLCSGKMQLKELPTSLAVPPSLGITFFEAVSTLLNLPCERFRSQASCHRKPLPATWP